MTLNINHLKILNTYKCSYICFFQLFARITKLGWFDVQDEEYVFRNEVSDVTKFIQVCYVVSRVTELNRYLFWSLMLQNLNTKRICYLVSDFTTFIQIVMWSSMLQNLYRYDMWSLVLQNFYTLLCVVYVT